MAAITSQNESSRASMVRKRISKYNLSRGAYDQITKDVCCMGYFFKSRTLKIIRVFVAKYFTNLALGVAAFFLMFGLSFTLSGCGATLAQVASSGSSGGSTQGPSAFSFTNQTGVSQSATIVSNTVTLSGFTGPLAADCNGCSAIIRDGVVGTTSAIFSPGDTVALEVLSSSSANTAVTATLTVGATTSGTWSVTTGSGSSNTPVAFNFQNQTNVIPNTTISSNAVQISGFTGTLTATCDSGCTNIEVEGVWQGATTATVSPGNWIAIQQTSSSSTSTLTSASITIGSTTSSPWTVTTSATTDPCSGSPTIGTTCADGTIYAGLSPDGNVPMYTTPCDIGLTWTGSVCSGVRLTETWNDGSTNYTVVGASSATSGSTNTATLVAQGTSPSPAPYNAARYCATMSANGHSDWYLPSTDELNVLYTNEAAIGNFDLSGNYYWSSTEYSSNYADNQQFSSGTQPNNIKNATNDVRCVRK